MQVFRLMTGFFDLLSHPASPVSVTFNEYLLNIIATVLGKDLIASCSQNFITVMN